MCDWNNNGRLDLITGERNGFFTLFLRKEDGTLTNAGRIQANGADIRTENNSWAWVCDWNNDGRKDLLVGQEGGRVSNVYLYLNQGEDSLPVFEDTVRVLRDGAPFTDLRSIPLALDLDGDGRKDLVLGEWYSSVRFYRNVGTDQDPVFTTYENLVAPDSTGYSNGNPPRIAFADWNGNGLLDMITCDYGGSVFLRLNVTQVGVEHRPGFDGPDMSPGPTVLNGVPDDWRSRGHVVYDVQGRRVDNPAAGVYFVYPAPGTGNRVSRPTRVVIAR